MQWFMIDIYICAYIGGVYVNVYYVLYVSINIGINVHG